MSPSLPAEDWSELPEIVTVKDEPSLETEPADALVVDDCDTPTSPAGLMGPPDPTSPIAPDGCRSTCWTVQSGSLIPPVWPPAVAEASLKVTLPKFAKGSCCRLPSGDWAEGASAIHSALYVSGLLMVSVWVTDWPVVLSDKEIVTLVPFTVTLPVIWSPGWMGRFNLTWPAGTSSYHA